MARYTGPITKKSRRLGTDLVGNDKAFEHRPYPPGQHGRGRTKDSEYRLQLREKQKARYAYGVLEKQFRRYYEEADRVPGKTGDAIAAKLTDTSSPEAQAILGAANVTTAQICALTGDQPGDVCSAPGVVAAKAVLG